MKGGRILNEAWEVVSNNIGENDENVLLGLR